ncbi:MAG TPA: hypothetical protein V6D33_19465 [Cyanophyceae cyanobacterium]
MSTAILIYSLLLFWIIGAFESSKPKAKPKTPEEELGTAIAKYLVHTKKAGDSKSSD